jgi:hypothetical protein
MTRIPSLSLDISLGRTSDDTPRSTRVRLITDLLNDVLTDVLTGGGFSAHQSQLANNHGRPSAF